ncbi:uncharacterized protein LOC100501166 [Zea mays]|uniref:Uncharacterized protein n=1 Tax=Zea mays TaxID=4577 RepID=C4J1I2_MAIZE|nr:uncharacterized protein LOC100501166 [Zea mays]ACR35032.1 unknown [Zea mays]|eukprot:NP_001182890.1 uncharacterized protein LOC100501166 [Zea mays]
MENQGKHSAQHVPGRDRAGQEARRKGREIEEAGASLLGAASNKCHRVGIGNGGSKDRSQSESGRLSGGSEWLPLVELPARTSCMVRSAATVLRKMPCSASATASAAAAAWPRSRASGNTASIKDSHSRTRCDTVSVLKKGCCSTDSITASRSIAPVRLSYFLRILARPAGFQFNSVQLAS